MNYPTYGNAKVLTVTGATVITSANAYIIGVSFQGSATNSCQIWQGVTATGSPVSNLLRGTMTAGAGAGTTVAAATYLQYPAYCSGGITVNVGDSLDVKLTLFWNPAGGA